jgi:DNA-binding transcriptional regulator YhcF (GntR family)
MSETALDTIMQNDAAAQWSIPDLSPQRFLETEPAPFDFLIPGLLSKGVVGFIYGEGGSYKSLAALWLVYQRAVAAVHCSGKWLDHFEITKAGKSIFFSAEDVALDLHHRTWNIVRAIKAQRFDVPETAFHREIAENCLIIPREKWVADGQCFLVDQNGLATEKQKEIIAITNDFHADLLVLETYSRIANVDEINNQQAARVVGCLENIRDATGATILCIAHSGKVARIGKTDTHGQNGLRGASALLDNSRFGLWFRALKPCDGRDQLEILNSKAFRCKRSAAFKVKVNFPTFEQISDAADAELFDQIVDDVMHHPGTKQRETRKRIGANQTASSRAFREAEDEGRIYLKSHREGYFVVDENDHPIPSIPSDTTDTG